MGWDVASKSHIYLYDQPTQKVPSATILQNVVVLEAAKDLGLVSLMLNPNEAQYAVLSIDDKKTVWLARRTAGDGQLSQAVPLAPEFAKQVT